MRGQSGISGHTRWLRTQTLFKSKPLTSRPADEVISEFLPDGAAFCTCITARMADAQPIATVRRAFANCFPSELVALPGTTPARHAVSSGAGASRSADAASGDAAKKNTRKGTEREAADISGSKSGLSKILANGYMFLAARVADVKAIANSLDVKVDDHSWPVLFSNKPGKAALALCPCPDKNGGLNSNFIKFPRASTKRSSSRNSSRQQAPNNSPRPDGATSRRARFERRGGNAPLSSAILPCC